MKKLVAIMMAVSCVSVAAESRKLVTIAGGKEVVIAVESNNKWELSPLLSLSGLHGLQNTDSSTIDAQLINDKPTVCPPIDCEKDCPIVPPIVPPVSLGASYLPGGSANMAVSWANLTVGKLDSDVGYRFRAPVSGTVESYVFNLQHERARPGYSAGNGGEYVVKLVRDDGSINHRPSFKSADVIAEGTIKYKNGNIYSEKYVDERPFNVKAGAIKKGELYHLWFRNSLATSAQRKANWASVNALNNGGNYKNPIQAGFPNLDLFTMVFYRSNNTFVNLPERTPIFAIKMKGSGITFGQGHFSQRSVSGRHYIGGKVEARQMYTHSVSSKTYSYLMLNLMRRGTPKNLSVVISEESGKVLQSFLVPSSRFKADRGWWASIKLQHPVLFEKDKTYYIALSSPGSTGSNSYVVSDSQKGYKQFFESSAPGTMNVRYGKNYAQLKTSAGKWLDGWMVRGNIVRDADLPLYLGNIKR